MSSFLALWLHFGDAFINCPSIHFLHIAVTRIFLQIAPLDSPTAMDNFLVYWDPVAIFLMESELWPNLIISSAAKGVRDTQ